MSTATKTTSKNYSFKTTYVVYASPEKVFEALKAGATGYLLKNTELQQLTEALKELHNGGSPMSSNIARKLVTVFSQQAKNTKALEFVKNQRSRFIWWCSPAPAATTPEEACDGPDSDDCFSGVECTGRRLSDGMNES